MGEQGPGAIEEQATLLLFCETSSSDEQKALEEALEPVAKNFLEKQKASGGDLEVAFMIVTAPSGLAPRIRGMLGLPGLPLQPHEHAMEKKEDSSGGWGCDGCNQSGEGKERYRCVKGCDFDFCGDCYAKILKGPKVEKMAPRMALLDIPSDGAYYLADEGELERKQLS